MKKLLILLTTLASVTFVNAQEESIRFGAKAGVNIANLTGENAEDTDSKIGFNLGTVVEIPLSDKFAVQPELLFSTQGTKTESNNEISSFESTVNASYINLPIMAKYYIAEGLSIQAGPQLGFLIGGKTKSESTTKEIDTGFGDPIPAMSRSSEEDTKKTIKGFDFGLNFGLGYQLESGLFFDARYNLGLSNIADFKTENDNGDDVDGELKNSVISVSIGYKF